MNKVKVWLGNTTCDFCKRPIYGALYDARTFSGQWATMCKTCWMEHAGELGTGKGQRYTQEPAGEFVKVEG